MSYPPIPRRMQDTIWLVKKFATFHRAFNKLPLALPRREPPGFRCFLCVATVFVVFVAAMREWHVVGPA